jgi:Reverse transcriptase (RNA-dependent DNA polymerase)
MLLRWKDGAETWVPLKDLKEAYLVQVAEYATLNQIHNEPAFLWWVPHVMSKRAQIVAKVKTKYWQKTYKYGIEIPKSIAEARRINAKNGNTLWWDAICQEMKNAMIAFIPWTGEKPPVGHKQIQCHFIFYLKLGENFRHKARYVAQGNRMEDPDVITFSLVVLSHNSVRIALLLAALNGLELKACDIKNAYLTAPNKEKVYIVAGPEFDPELCGQMMIVQRALYRLKSAGPPSDRILPSTSSVLTMARRVRTLMFGCAQRSKLTGQNTMR